MARVAPEMSRELVDGTNRGRVQFDKNHSVVHSTPALELYARVEWQEHALERIKVYQRQDTWAKLDCQSSETWE